STGPTARQLDTSAGRRDHAGVCGAALADRVAAVRETIAAAARRAGRDPSTVRIVAVTKTFPPAVVTAALAAGLEDVGENYVQEARAKRRAVGPGGTWHLIGGLQRNKVRAAVATFDWMHTVDSATLARARAAAAARAAPGERHRRAFPARGAARSARGACPGDPRSPRASARGPDGDPAAKPRGGGAAALLPEPPRAARAHAGPARG